MAGIEYQQRVEQLVAERDVPGAVLGVLADGETHVFAAGVLNRATGVPVTADSVFQIGSNTKVWTATLVLQLVDEGLVDLDAPLRTYLPEFTLADETVAAGTTVRHLLTHTSGIEGDVFDDVGRNDDCLERYVAALAQQGSVHDLDETWSYCNSGFVLAGRVVEVVTGTSWDQALRARLGQPLGMTQLCTNADEAIVHRAAVGHIPHPETKELIVTPQWGLPRALGPAGLITTSMRDLLAFARLHLEEGRAPDGAQVLSPGSVKLMQTPQADCPEKHVLGDAWGLGWILNFSEGRTIIGHGGNTIGQATLFDAVPDRRVAVALVTNAGSRGAEMDEVMREVLADVAGVHKRPRPAPGEAPGDLDVSRYVGRYERFGVTTEVAVGEEGALTATFASHGPIAAALGMDKPIVAELRYFEPDVFVTQLPGAEGWVPVRFYGGEAGEPTRFVHTGGRVAKRVQ
jgi:CubicO group peptidase (beta-lactamase class C family)